MTLRGPGGALHLAIGLAIVSTVLMAWKGRRVGMIAMWFLEVLSGIERVLAESVIAQLVR